MEQAHDMAPVLSRSETAGSRRTVRIGFLGFGTVGQGVWKHVRENRRRLEARLGARLELARAAVRQAGKKRGVALDAGQLTTNGREIVEDDSIDIVCELMGGTGEARELTLEALRRGKVVISANKALLCEHGEELFATARKHGGQYFFEASVAGGIPIIKALREGLVANRFPLIYGILNGTCNYLLTRMEREGLAFEPLLEEARALGFVEADESLDVDGWDTAHKAVVLAWLAHGKWVRYDEMVVEGIRKVTQDDIAHARSLGYAIKLLAVVKRDFASNRLFVSVHPALVSRRNVLANLDGPYNGVSVTGDIVGTTCYIGRGAGQDATSSAVISDIADAVLWLQRCEPRRDEPSASPGVGREPACGILPLENVESSFYLRLMVKDAAGVLAEVASVMGRHLVSIATVLQKTAATPGRACLILTTHVTNERAMKNTVEELAGLESLLEPPFLLRVAAFEE